LVAGFNTFAHSNFSDSQLLIVRNLLIADYSQAGIYVPPELPDSLFQFEWKRILSHPALAAIFRLTFTEPTIAKAILDANCSIAEAVSQYKIKVSPLRDRLGCRNQCLKRVEEILDYELAKSFPGKSTRWITWGFSSFDKRMSSCL